MARASFVRIVSRLEDFSESRRLQMREKRMSEFSEKLFRGRPWWMTALMILCALQVFVLLPGDLFFRPLAEDQEVWFGYVLTGWPAKLTTPIHLLIYAFGMVGFFGMRSWMHPWAALYTLQVAIGSFVWCIRDESVPLVGAIVTLVAVLALVWLLWQSKDRFVAGD
jgi:hypothetical protein